MKKNTTTAKKVAPKKVTPKKEVAKKVVAKKVLKKVSVTEKKPLVVASNKQSFWLVDGQILNSLVALETVLAEMEKSIFEHHVAKDKNDFAVWVEVVLEDKDCAALLKKAKTPKAAKTAVSKSLNSYKI
jgi:formyltetrahydrofolate synthetase